MTTRTSNRSILDQIPSATTGATPPQLQEWWPTEFLEPMIFRADPLADRIMQLLYAEGRADAERLDDPSFRPRRILQFLNALINQMSIPDPDADHPFSDDPEYHFTQEEHDALEKFLSEGSKLPPWADFDLIEQAQQLFSDNPIVAYVLLACISLPVLYTCGRGGVQVLTLSEQLVHKVRRRVIETGMLIITGMQQGAFTKVSNQSTLTKPLPPGIEGILRVRLLHAATRTVIHEFWQDGLADAAAGRPTREYQGRSASKMWREEWGLPIHQQYMTGTLMTFSYISLYGLEKLGVPTSDQEKKAYMHYWNVFGHVLGLEEETLMRLDFPRTKRAVYEGGKPVHAASGQEMYDVGRALYTQMVTLNRSKTPEAIAAGRVLTKGVCDYLAFVLKERLFIGKLIDMRHIPNMMMRMMLSNDDCELLGIQKHGLDYVLVPLTLSLFWIRGIFAKAVGAPVYAISNWLLRYMQEDIMKVYDDLRKTTGARYAGIPMEFQEKWGLLKKKK